jgi:ABC-type spermidine/putrescine transport system permease subunit II
LKAFISSSVETSKETTQERLLLARVVSPGVAYSLSFAIFGIIFAWSKSFTISAIATIVMALPYFLLFIAFPGTRLQSLARIRRNVLIETAMVAGATYLIYFFVQLYPAETIQKSEAFILLGLIPVLLHGVFSLLHASAEMTKREVDNAQR